MSASLATPMLGLPNLEFSPDNMPDFTATDFPDHMESDRSPGTDKIDYRQPNNDSPEAQRRDSAHAGGKGRSSAEEQQALGNLLGALVPNQTVQNGDATNLDTVSDCSPAVQYQPIMTEQLQSDNPADYIDSRLPSFDLSAPNELFPNENFTNLNQTMDLPQTPNGQTFDDMVALDFRQDSFASQGGVARRPVTPQQREFEAFARLQFEDGSYYLNTYSCELGRDVLAYRAALQKEREEREAELNGNGKSRSSSGKMSHRSGRVQRPIGSQIQGSVISDLGGFAGIDEAPMGPPKNPEKPSMSSQESESSIVKPAEYLINPHTLSSFDYHRSTEIQAQLVAQEENNGVAPDDEQPAAVTADHLPNPHMCPLIPIHGRTRDGQTEGELHKKISRRHVRIQWSFDRDCWEMKVQGRNGAFCNGKFVRWKGVVPLHDGATIQIAHVLLTFRLPKTAQQQQEAEQSQAEIDADEVLPSVESRPSESVAGDERRESVTEQKAMPKISLKISQKVEPSAPELPLGPDGLPIIKRRGPGRPPKDGIMSTRERKEREKAAKLAAMREANGGKTPPPAMRGKLPQKSPPVVEEIKVDVKPEKRKYTKRKTMDEDGYPIADADGEADEGDGPPSDGEPKTKKARAQREKSESPQYPPRESLTAEQLARPNESYAQLLYKVLLDLYPRALPLKDIYRELKKRYPWFVHECQTEGWQSSVRHNLNSEFNKLFEKGDKEGKGFAWRAIPDAQLPQADKKRTTQASAQRARPPPPRSQFQPLPGQNIQWQGTGPFPTNNGQQPFINHGPWPPQNQPNGTWQQNGTPPTGAQQGPVLPAVSSIAQPRPLSQTPQPGGAQAPNQVQPGQAQNGSAAPTPASSAPAPSAGSAASNMPCTLDGMLAIKRFEQEMYRQIGIEDGPGEKREFWSAIFASAKKRVLHGYPSSTRPLGEIKAELTIMNHMQSFVEKFANPNFKGFTPRATQPNVAEQSPSETQEKPVNPPPFAIAPSSSPNPSTTGNNSRIGSSVEVSAPSVNGMTGESTARQTSSLASEAKSAVAHQLTNESAAQSQSDISNAAPQQSV